MRDAVVRPDALDAARRRFRTGGFVVTKLQTLLRAIRDDRLDRRCLRVLASLVEAMNEETLTTFVGRQTIAEREGIAVKSVSNYWAELRATGYVASQHMRTPQANNRVLLHHTLMALSPEEIETELSRALVNIRASKGSEVPVPTGTQVPVPVGTLAPSSRPGRNMSSRPDGRSNTVNITPVSPLPPNAAPADATDELACLNGVRFELVETMAAWISPYAPDHKTAEIWLGTAVSLHGGEVVKQAFGELRAKITQGDLVARPIPLLDKICQRIKADGVKKPKPSKPFVPSRYGRAHEPAFPAR